MGRAKPQRDPARRAEDDARQRLDGVKGDGSGDRTRSSDPGLLERDRHPCPGEACTARSQRHQARRGERRQPDEGRSDRVVDLQRVQDGCPARDAAGGGKRRPGEDGRAEPEPGQPVPPAGDRHDEYERREQQRVRRRCCRVRRRRSP
jgi:hypothetical protein